jgi:thioredoxin-dependent peroxiredoxin
MLNVGDRVPAMSLQTDTGETVSLADYSGQIVVLYFYPKAGTGGCTTEACEIRDEFAGFEQLEAKVIGASPDPVKALAKFRAQYELPFTLLADVDHALAEAFGVWGRKKFMGREYDGIHRSSFIIGPDGTIEHVFAKVTPKGHARELLAALGGGR